MGARMGVIEAGSKASRLRKKTWRGDLRDAALTALDDASVHGLIRDPVALTVVIVRRRPVAQVRTGRHAGEVKEWASALLPVERPDTVKIVRAAEDALTGVVWVDDSQIVRHSLHKAFGDQVGLTSTVEGLFVAVDPVAGYMGPQISFTVRDMAVAA
jgi:Holliday junction resolvase RusA-like endonuclease